MIDDNSNDQLMSRKEYRKKHHIPEPDETGNDHVSNQPKLSAEEKSLRLKHRLNILIITLVVLIVVTYLILYFVN